MSATQDYFLLAVHMAFSLGGYNVKLKTAKYVLKLDLSHRRKHCGGRGNEGLAYISCRTSSAYRYDKNIQLGEVAK